MNILYAMKISIILISVIYGIASAGKLSHRNAITTHSGSQGTGQSIESHPNSASQTDTRPMLLKSHTLNGAAIVDGEVNIFPYGEISVQTPIVNIGESGEIKIEKGYVTNGIGQQIQIKKGTLNVIRIPTDAQALSSVFAKTGITLNKFIQLTGDLLPQQRLFEITPSIISFDGIDRIVKTGILRILTNSQSIESHPNSASQTDTRPMHMLNAAVMNAAGIVDGQVNIFPYGDIRVQSPIVDIGESGEIKIETANVTNRIGQQIQVKGRVNVIRIPTDAQALSSVLAKSGIALNQFIQLTGDLLPQQRLFEITPSIFSFDGIDRNVKTGILRIMTVEIVQLLNPTDEGITLSGSQGTGQSIESPPNSSLQSDTRPIYLMKHIFNFALIIDGQVIVFPYGEIIIQAPILGIGESINIKIESGFATAGAGHTVQINGGTLNGVILPTDYQAISISLAKSEITPEQFVILIQFIQLTGAILPQHVFLELSPSILYIDGNYRNVNSGIMRIMSIEYLQLLNPTNEGAQIPVTNPDIEVFTTRTVLFTETAVHVTQTIYEPVTLTKTSTRDEYITLTSPVYNSIDVTITNFIKQTVNS